MSETDDELSDYAAAAKEFILEDEPESTDSHARYIKILKEHLGQAAEQGVKIEDILGCDWTKLAVETASGEIVLKPADSTSDEILRARVVSSEDPELQPDDFIAVQGLTTDGEWLMPGFVAPGARMAYAKAKIAHYRTGLVDSHEELTLTPQRIEEYTKGGSPAFVKTEDGMDLIYFLPGFKATDFVSHAVLSQKVGGTEKSRYLF